MTTTIVVSSVSDEDVIESAKKTLVGGVLSLFKASLSDCVIRRKLLYPFRAYEGQAFIEVVSARLDYDEDVRDTIYDSEGINVQRRSTTRIVKMSPGIKIRVDILQKTAVGQVSIGPGSMNLHHLRPGAVETREATQSEMSEAEMIRPRQDGIVADCRLLQQVEDANRSYLETLLRRATGCTRVRSLKLRTRLDSMTLNKLLLVPIAEITATSASGTEATALVGRFEGTPATGKTLWNPVRISITFMGLASAIIAIFLSRFSVEPPITFILSAVSGLSAFTTAYVWFM